MPKKLNVLIDTDPGVDDALALLLALNSPELEVLGVTVVAGNVALDKALRNARLTVEMSGVSNPPPIAAGAAKPLGRPLVDAGRIHGEDGLGGAASAYPAPRLPVEPRPAVDLILETLGARPGEVDLVALGPLTNIAAAIRQDPTTMRRARRLIVMGGAVAVGGNVTAAAEYNFFADPEAARIVVRSSLEPVIVPLDVTTRTLLDAGLAEHAPPFPRSILRHYFDVGARRYGRPCAPMHDPLTVGVALDKTLVEVKSLPADVCVESEVVRGLLLADRRSNVDRGGLPGSARIALDVDAERFIALFRERVLS